MGRHLTNSGLILPVIRKVISRDDFFICSICRTEYRSKVDANNCLNHCWLDVQQLYPVVLRKLQGRHIVFRCHFCCRDYKDESAALSCARRCQGDRNQQHVHEQLLNDLPIEAPSHRPSRIRLIAMRAAAPSAAVHKEPKAPAINTGHADIEVELPQETEVSNTPRRSKSDFPKRWIRMNEKYQCCYCRNLFYTKMETEACFNAHFDEGGMEKPDA